MNMDTYHKPMHVSVGQSEIHIGVQKDGAALVGRVLLAAIFVISGYGKIPGFEHTAGYIASKGLPFPELLTAIAIVIELGGALALVVGWKTRWAALALALFLSVITPIFHGLWAVPSQAAME